MPLQQPQLGSLAIQAPSLAPKTVHVSASTCHDLSLFKDLLKEYRRLDDSITMRLNRTTAQFRDRNRLGLGDKGTVEDEACMQSGRNLSVTNWTRRTEIVGYCVGVVDQSMEGKRMALDAETNDPAAQRRIQGALYAEEVKRNQVHNELVVEQIVRKRSLDAFRSRCKYFQPSMTDADARQWWDAAHAGR
ncbi:caffeine-induced death protein 2-domain-containing protein [Fomitopsis serialis]|uniref:caffeine-induced death protein 2-domain-containing protein n=1 Tax=Fomitopsis serialis TaxID=139415 RepID=UPI0020082CBE|nr:caffeine-induced death protein 2-domain-containing protein [Neoantrodia serialis]KAH9938272.1 caffeine-induced death protein 2-domain-containing protein [Neoantrodia serialis]